MARYAYDVDSRQKLLDTHKQFQGGLKTVDTDDSLKTLYMRDMSNLSLSEFGFLEKRYGQYEVEKIVEGLPSDARMQLYTTYTRDDGTVDEITIISGKLFLNGELVEYVYLDSEVEDARYPDKEVFTDLGLEVVDYNVYGAPDIVGEISYSYNIPVGDYVYFINVNPDYLIYAVPPAGYPTQYINAYDDRLWIYQSGDAPNAQWYSPSPATAIDIVQAISTTGLVYNTATETYLDLTIYSGGTSFYRINTTDPQPDISVLMEEDFQRTHDMQSTRIDDNLYIMTGTYPIYYRGTGSFYIMPIYEPSQADIAAFSHNTLENDFNEAYRFTYTHTDMPVVEYTDANEDIADFVPFKEYPTTDYVSFYPKLPYNNEEDKEDTLAGLNVRAGYQIRKDSEAFTTNFSEFYTNEFLQLNDTAVIKNPEYIYMFVRGADDNASNSHINNYKTAADAVSAVAGLYSTDFPFNGVPLGTNGTMMDSTIALSKLNVKTFYQDWVGTTVGAVGAPTLFPSTSPFVEDSETETVVDLYSLLASVADTPYTGGLKKGDIIKVGILGDNEGTSFVRYGYVRWKGWDAKDSDETLDIIYDKHNMWYEELYNWRTEENAIRPARNEVRISMDEDNPFKYSKTSWGFEFIGTPGDINVFDKLEAYKYQVPTAAEDYNSNKTYLKETDAYTEKSRYDDILYELFPVILTRPAGGTEAEWVELDNDYYEGRQVYSNASETSSFAILDQVLNEDTENPIVFGLDEEFNYLGRIEENTAPFEFRVTKLPYGNIDIKIAIVFRKSGYYDDLKVARTVVTDGAETYEGEDIIWRWKQESWSVNEYIMRDITVTNEQLKDFEDIPKSGDYPDMWSCKKVFNHYGKLIAYDSDKAPDYIYVSHPTFHNYFPYFFTQQFKTDSRQPVVAITPFQNVLIVQSPNYTWGLSGADAVAGLATSYNQFTVSPIYGTIAPKSVRPVRNHLYFLSQEGIVALKALYASDQVYNVEIIDKNIRNIVPFYDTDAVGIQYDDQYWLNFPNSPDNITLRYYIDYRAWVKDSYFYKKLDSEWSDYEFNGVETYLRGNGSLDYISKPMRYQDGSYYIARIRLDKETPTDLEENIFSYFETAFLNQNYPFHPKQYKEVKFDFTVQNEYNVKNTAIYNDTLENFNAATDIELMPRHWYQLEFDADDNIFDIIIDGNGLIDTLEGIDSDEVWDGNLYQLYPDADPIVQVYENQELIATFDDANGVFQSIGTADYDVVYTRYSEEEETESTDQGIDIILYDATYDDKITFRTWVMTEDNLLNLDNNITSYDADLADLEQNLGTNFGKQWEFGDSDFGNRTLTTKTVRLAGKGKNIKVYFEEEGKTKWTMETLGIMFKLKRARGTR